MPLASALLGCHAAARPSVSAAPPRLVRVPAPPVVVVSDDRTLARQLQQELSTFGPGISIEVHRGVAYLRGRIGSETQRERATRVARQIPGVLDVVNLLQSARARP